MKKFLSLLVVVIMLITSILSMTACSKEGDEVEFVWWGSSERNMATDDMIKEFYKKYPQYKDMVDPITLPWEGYAQNLNTALNQGTEADLMQINYNWVHSWGKLRQSMDMKDLNIDLTKWPEGENDALKVIDYSTNKEKLSAISVSETGAVFYLNKATYEAAGITELPKTWKELIEAGRIINARDSKCFALGRLDGQSGAMIMFSWLSQKYGINVIEDDKLAFTQDQLKEGLNFLKTLKENGVINQNDPNADGPNNENWKKGYYGGVLQWNTAISEYYITAPNGGANLVCVGMFQQSNTESENKGVYKKVSMAYAVSNKVAKNSKKKALIEDFLNFMFTDEKAVKALGVDRGIPSHATAQEILRNAGSEFTDTLEWKGHDYVQSAYNSQKAAGIDLYIHPYYEHETFRLFYEDLIEKLLSGVMTEEAVAGSLYRGWNNALASAMEG